MVREIKTSPMLFGYRGSELVDVTQVERLIRRVAQLQNDLPAGAPRSSCSLVLAGADGATVLTASARVEPVADPRSDRSSGGCPTTRATRSRAEGRRALHGAVSALTWPRPSCTDWRTMRAR